MQPLTPKTSISPFLKSSDMERGNFSLPERSHEDNLHEDITYSLYGTQHHQMRHTQVLSKWQIKEEVLSRNSKEIMLFSIFSGKYDGFLGFTCVLHRFYYWLYVSLMLIKIRMVKRQFLNPFSSYSRHQNIVHSANSNLASNYDTLFFYHSECSPLSHCVKTSISEFPTYASIGGGGSHFDLPPANHLQAPH